MHYRCSLCDCLIKKTVTRAQRGAPRFQSNKHAGGVNMEVSQGLLCSSRKRTLAAGHQNQSCDNVNKQTRMCNTFPSFSVYTHSQALQYTQKHVRSVACAHRGTNTHISVVLWRAGGALVSVEERGWDKDGQGLPQNEYEAVTWPMRNSEKEEEGGWEAPLEDLFSVNEAVFAEHIQMSHSDEAGSFLMVCLTCSLTPILVTATRFNWMQ